MNSKMSRWIEQGKALLRQGLTPRQLALSIAVGVVIGIIPMLGVATFLVTGITIYFRLNLPLAFFVAYAVTPLQWLLFIPFIHLGEFIFQIDQSMLSLSAIASAYEVGILNLIQVFFWEITYGMVAWCILVIPITWSIYLAAIQLFRHYRPSKPS